MDAYDVCHDFIYQRLMNINSKLFLVGFDEGFALIMHCVSRVVDRQFLMKIKSVGVRDL
jgi:hypothetical protein